MANFNTFFGTTALGPPNYFKYNQGFYELPEKPQTAPASSTRSSNSLVNTMEPITPSTTQFSSLAKLKEARTKHSRNPQDPQDIYQRPVTAAQEVGWHHKTDLQKTRFFKMNDAGGKNDREATVKKMYLPSLDRSRKTLRQTKSYTGNVEQLKMHEHFPKQSCEITRYASDMIKIGQDWLR